MAQGLKSNCSREEAASKRRPSVPTFIRSKLPFFGWLLLLLRLEQELNPVGNLLLPPPPVLLAEPLPLCQIRDGVEELGSD